jgi:hypothetical protein
MNAREPSPAAATVSVPVADKFWLLALAVAVTTSDPLQPVAEYVALAIPVLVVAVAEAGDTPVAAIVARPWAWHGELNVTGVEVVYRAPVLSTMETCKLVLPPAERDFVDMASTPP